LRIGPAPGGLELDAADVDAMAGALSLARLVFQPRRDSAAHDPGADDAD
jgi:hypothetical protein